MLLSIFLLLGFLHCLSLGFAQQTPLGAKQQQHDQGVFTEFSTLSADEFTILTHPAFPRYSVRVKKSEFCDGTVNSYTGYIDIEVRHLFFYFFESRGDPYEDDVIFWVNGGPGGSSAMGLFMELGPCKIFDANGPKFNPFSWNSNANVLFVDQPIGVGFSYADYGETVSTTEDAAKDMAAFVAIFFENSKLKGIPFHMASESYGGRYLPLFAGEIIDQNNKLVELGGQPINLTSIMIGNGFSDFHTMFPSFYDMACTAASVGPVLNIKTCVAMKLALPQCQKWLKESCMDILDSISCSAANAFCFNEFMLPVYESGLNPFFITRKCEGTIEETTCYSETIHVQTYLNLPEVRATLGVDPLPGNFTLIAKDVNRAFDLTLDSFRPSEHHVTALLERGIRVLIYVGMSDWICNHLGNEHWTLNLEWSGKAEFVKERLREWSVDGKKVGMTRGVKGLTYVTVEDAGHMVPYDKPKEALAIVNRWITRQDF